MRRRRSSTSSAPRPATSATRRKIEDARGRYVVFCKSTFPTRAHARRPEDRRRRRARRGATASRPPVFEELGADVDRDRHQARRQEHQRARRRAAPARRCARRCACTTPHLGIALDGDADRCVAVDEHGNVVDGDAVMALCATRMLRRGQLAKKTLVATVMSNLGLERALASAGGKRRAHAGRRPLRRRGDARERLQPRRRAVGPPRLPRPRDDRRRHRRRAAGARDHGARRQAAVGAREGDDAEPQVLVNVAVDKQGAARPAARRACGAIADVEKQLGDDGRVLVRYSRHRDARRA